MAAQSVETLLREKKIFQIINPKLVQCPSSLPLKDVIELMQKSRSGYVVVADNKKVAGIFTEVDVVRKVLNKNVHWDSPIREFMAKDPLCLNPNESVGKAIEIMGANRFYHLPLVNENNELVNVLSVRSLIRFLAEFYPTEVFNLPPVANQIMTTQEGG